MQRSTFLTDGGGRLRGLRRMALLGVLTALGLTFAGDRAFLQVTSTGGIDPLEALDIQVKSNVLVVLDTSEGMRSPVDAADLPVGDDDIEGRFYQAKKALTDALTNNADRFSFGLVTWGPDSSVVNGDGVASASNQVQNTPGAYDGPFVYVSFDTNASVYYTQTACIDSAGSANTISRFFCAPRQAFDDYEGRVDFSEQWASFSNSSGQNAGSSSRFADPYPRGCSGTDCRYYIQSRFLRDDVRFTVNHLTAISTSNAISGVSTSSCGTPPSGVFAEDDSDRPCFILRDEDGNLSTFWYVSTAFAPDSVTSCDATTDETAGVNTTGWTSDCTASPAAATIAHMTADLGVAVPVDDIAAYRATETGDVASSKDAGGDSLSIDGVRTKSGSGRPIAAALASIVADRSFPESSDSAVAALQYNFVLLVTSGSDLCADADPDEATRLAAVAAESLYSAGDQRELLVVAFTSDADAIARLNRIALAGSGGEVQADGTVTCAAGVSCRTAFIANKADQIDEAIQDALEIAARTGEFSTAAVTNANVFEYGPLLDPDVDPDDPGSRYDARLNIVYQSTIEMPGWKGHLYAFINDGTGTNVVDSKNATGEYDAGQKLYETTVEPMLDADGNKERSTFATLHAGATARNIRTSSAILKRRVFTSSPSAGSGSSVYNRGFTRSTDSQYDAALDTGSNVVALWPPNQTGLTNSVSDIDPASGTSGPLDSALGLTGFSVAEMQVLGACQESLEAGSGAAPADCASAVGSAQADMLRKESRQIMLAWAGGAQVARSTDDGLPLRDATSGELLFEARDWLLGDTTLPQPVVVTPPLSATPQNHVKEWLLYRDGRRDGDLEGIPEVSKGFGLRNPDFDNGTPADAPGTKPLMSIVYSAHNDGLHAFRAGGSCAKFTPRATPTGVDAAQCAETGGEELWTFIPVDQVHKLYYLVQDQKVDPHIYITASSIRVADIFIPGSFTVDGQSFSGRWRTVLYFGRGAGGKFYTALDVSGAGPYTEEALDTNPPWVMWNRGNEDSRVPLPTTGDAGFDGMGETWSTPAIGRSERFGVEYVAWTGSGFGDSTSEGSTFFVLSAIDGSIIGSSDVGQGTATYVASNALVASPSLYNEYFLKPIADLTSVTDRVTRAYIPDVHGRVWRFDGTTGWTVTAPGPGHPIGDPLGLMILDVGSGDQTWVFGGSGNDSRVPLSAASPFEIFSFSDTTSAATPTPITYTALPLNPTSTTNVSGFRRTLLDSSNRPYRNVSQPATVLNAAGFGRVFYLARRFDGTLSDCTNVFTSLLFGLGAASGGAAYDFSNDGTADLFSQLDNTRATYLSTQGGGVYVSTSGSTTGVPSPPAPAIGSTEPAAPVPPSITVSNVKANTAVCGDYF